MHFTSGQNSRGIRACLLDTTSGEAEGVFSALSSHTKLFIGALSARLGGDGALGSVGLALG